jgi:hypothetical protein
MNFTDQWIFNAENLRQYNIIMIAPLKGESASQVISA